MVSRYAIDVVEDRMERGVIFTPAEIVRLNALGLKVEKNTRAADDFAVPRVAFVTLPRRRFRRRARVVVFREPTIGAQLWIDAVARYCDFDSDDTLVAVHAFAMAHDSLPPAESVWRVRRAVQRFINSTLRFMTKRQLLTALDYCRRGNDAAKYELAADNPNATGEVLIDRESMSVAAGVLHDGVAVRLGLSVAELKRMTADEVRRLVANTIALGGNALSEKELKRRADADFMRTLDEICAAAEGRRKGRG